MIVVPVKKGKSNKIEEQLVNPNLFLGCKPYVENNIVTGVIFYIDPIGFKGSLFVPKFNIQDIIDLMIKAKLPLADYREDGILFNKAII